jgi:alkylation response protein AidB-like acyl-CoA dehydrogenase
MNAGAPNDSVALARELLPLITGQRETTESERRLARPIVDALVSARLCRGAITRALGGLELAPTDALALYETLARAEASVAWIVWNNALPSLFSRFLAPAVRAEVFADPGWMYACSTRPSGRAALDADGYRVMGRWALVSGCEFAEWIMVRAVIEENGAPRLLAPGMPEVRMIWLRRGEFEILDTWYTGGLRGSGSHDVVVDGKIIPKRLTCSPLDGSSLEGALGRVPIVCNMAAGYAAQLLGLGGAAVDALVELSRNKPAIDPGPSLKERPVVLASVAEHQTRLAAAREHLHGAVARQWALVEGSSASAGSIADVFAAAHHAMAQGRAAVEAMYAAAGASALYISSPLERIHRDMHTMAAHVIAQPLWMEDTGRVRLGFEPVNPLYLV